VQRSDKVAQLLLTVSALLWANWPERVICQCLALIILQKIVQGNLNEMNPNEKANNIQF